MKRPFRTRLIIGTLVLAQAWTPIAHAATQNPGDVTAAITQAASTAMPSNAKITLGPILGAQYMQACTVPLAVTITGTEPYDQAAVHCTAQGWTLYVTVTEIMSAAVVVAVRPIIAGQTIQSGDLAIHDEPMTLYAGRQVFYDPAKLAGATALISVAAGAIITQSNIGAPVIVQAGQTVSVQVFSGDVSVTLTARADQTGRIGDTILMTNPSSGQRFSALVTASGPVLQLH